MNRRSSVALLVVLELAFLAACATTDAGITARVEGKLASDDLVKTYPIAVTTEDGVVTLTAKVDTEEEKERALGLARSTKGVVAVVDRISARTAETPSDAPIESVAEAIDAIDDAAITMSVKSKLLDDPQVKGLRIDVDTRDGVVFLTGSVGTESERLRAIQLAKDTKGVRDVEANLTLRG